MSFARQSLDQLVDQAMTDIDGELTGADARLAVSNLNVLSIVLAGMADGLHGHLDWLAFQVIWDSARNEYLERWAGMFGVWRKPAACAIGVATITGNTGTVILEGTRLQRADGALYETTAEATIADGTAALALSAVEPGLAGNAAAGVKLASVEPIAGARSPAEVAVGGISAGTDIETIPSLLARFLARLREPPHGGAAHDWRAWTLEVEGATRAWVYPGERGLGTVTIRFVMDGKADTIIPSAIEIALVAAHLDEVRPVTAEPVIEAPVAAPLSLTIALSPDTAATRAAVQAEVAAFVARESEPGATIYLSRLSEAISGAIGETRHRLVSPIADVAHAVDHMAVPGVITWVAY
jgi:uncharacterized phage protein gp47/JayE